MVLGVGTDIVKIDRIRKIVEKYNFMDKCFTQKEQEYLKSKSIESIAGYFSAKEAIVKAMETGFRGFRFTDVEVLREENEPFVILHGKALEIAKNKGIEKIKLSISHEREYAISTAIAIKAISEEKNNKGEGYPLSILKERKVDSNKGDYGKISLIGGSYSMSGAIILSAKGALRAGAGLVNCVIPKCILDRVAGAVYEATYTPLNDISGTVNLEEKDIELIIEKSTAIGFGIGIGFKKDLLYPLEKLIFSSDKPLVIDADGLNILSTNVDILKSPKRKCQVVLTPHPLEMKRLTGLSVEYINGNREMVAKTFAKENNCIVLLKGHRTVVTNGADMYINETGNPGMATGGSGDVLTGVITSLIGQGYSPYEAATLGSYVHGLSGDYAYEKYGYGLIAGDIADNIGRYIK